MHFHYNHERAVLNREILLVYLMNDITLHGTVYYTYQSAHLLIPKQQAVQSKAKGSLYFRFLQILISGRSSAVIRGDSSGKQFAFFLSTVVVVA